MSMGDPIADMLTRIRNAQSTNKPTVSMPASKLEAALLLAVLKDEGYIDEFAVAATVDGKPTLNIGLKKYCAGRPVIEED